MTSRERGANIPIDARSLGLADDPRYQAMGPWARRWFWRSVGPLAKKTMDRQLAHGIAASGEPLERVCYRGQHKRRKGQGPPLTPHRGRSRTRRLLTWSPMRGQGVTLWWKDDWGRILGYHAQGLRRKRCAPVLVFRNVFGLAPRFVKELQKKARALL